MANDELDPATFLAEVKDALEQVNARLARKQADNFAYADPPQPGTNAFAKLVDHTILKPETTEQAVLKVCNEAIRWQFKTVCVRAHHVSIASSHLSGTDVAVCSVVCFPEGTQSTDDKVSEATHALAAGATELDFVINYPQLSAADYSAVYAELCTISRSVSRATTSASLQQASSANVDLTIKLILETSQLSSLDIVAGCLLASKAGFDFVKTSTGFLGHGATEEHVRLMREVCEMEGGRMRVKASGGIRTAQDAKTMLDAGAERLGLSGSVAIMEEGMRGDISVRDLAGGDGY